MIPSTKSEVGDVREHINHLFIELFQIDPAKLKEDQRLVEDLGLDSLDAVDLGLRFQKQFQINISPSDLIGIKTLGDVYLFVENKLQGVDGVPPTLGEPSRDLPSGPKEKESPSHGKRI